MKNIKLPANPVGLIALVIVGGILANVATAPAVKKFNEAKGKVVGGAK